MKSCPLAAGLVLVVSFATPVQPVQAQTDVAPLEHLYVPFALDTGWVQHAGTTRGVAYSTIVHVANRPWIRLQFDGASLGRTPVGGQPTILRITSLLDGSVQLLNGRHLQEWCNTSAYFNGDTVQVEIIADPGAPPSRLVMSEVITGHTMGPNDGGIASICFGTDNRVLSSEAANGRHMPVGCTAWIIDDPNHTMLTAGHCGPSAGDVVQFNVPLSNSGGGLVAPPPQDQYAVDGSSVQFTAGGSGNDWCYFGCFANSVSGDTPYQAQLAFYALANTAPSLGNPAQQIRITGYGTTGSPISPTWNQVQKTHTGPYVSLSNTTIAYQTDTTGGNSGSPVVDLTTNTAIGIHTHGGCDSGGGANLGTAIHHSGLQNALANPQGVCIPNLLEFVLPDGIPEVLSPFGDSIRVEVLPGTVGTPLPGSGMLHLDTGGGFVTIPMSEVSPNVYDAIFDPMACTTVVHFFFSAQDGSGRTVFHPFNAPAATFQSTAASGVVTTFADAFETDLGWTVSNQPGLTSGAWQRVIPTATGSRVPSGDADDSGRCYVTDNAQSNDVDGGSTTLTSPLMDASKPGATLSYWRWFSTSSGSGVDTLRVEASSNGGASWVQVETFTSTTTGWNFKQWSIDEIAGIVPNTQFRVRFVATDTGSGSTVEAAVDGIKITSLICPPQCPADLDESGFVDGADLGILLGTWGQTGAADFDGSGSVDGGDLGVLLGEWGPCAIP